MDAAALRRRQKSNKIVAKFIPALLIGIVGYASWVFVGPLCLEYLINTPQDAEDEGIRQRIGVGIALAIVYFVLLIPMAVVYLRVLLTVTLDPGLIPQGRASKAIEDKAPDAYDQTVTVRSCAPTTIADHQEPTTLDYEGILKQRVPPPPGIEDFYTKDVFVCDANGLPLWCARCANWKPDRSHHCSDVGRCVTRFDHFCPWVGGVVGENSYKFFVQFTAYATTFSAYTLICMAIFVAESKHTRGTIGNVHWVVVIGLAGFFALFTFGLNVMSCHMVLVNRTTVENIDSARQSMYLAVLLPPELQSRPDKENISYPPLAHTSTPLSRSAESEEPLTSEIDDPAHEQYFRPSQSRKRSRSKSERARELWHGTITYPTYLSPDRPPLPAPAMRTFAILRTPPGMNPWNLSPYHNFTSVFGRRLHDWVFPLRHSTDRGQESDVSFYPMGWEFEDLLVEAKLLLPESENDGSQRDPRVTGRSRGRRKRRRRLDEGWQNGERPDAWVMEKEVRRNRKMREREGFEPDVRG